MIKHCDEKKTIQEQKTMEHDTLPGYNMEANIPKNQVIHVQSHPSARSSLSNQLILVTIEGDVPIKGMRI